MITEAEQKEFVEDTKWLHTHYDEILDKYNEQYIAIQHQSVLDSAKNIETLGDKLKKRNIKAQDVFIEYIKDRIH